MNKSVRYEIGAKETDTVFEVFFVDGKPDHAELDTLYLGPLALKDLAEVMKEIYAYKLNIVDVEKPLPYTINNGSSYESPYNANQ